MEGGWTRVRVEVSIKYNLSLSENDLRILLFLHIFTFHAPKKL